MIQSKFYTMAATLRASTKGLDLVDKARRKKGWAKTCTTWAQLATTSEATLRRFWAGKQIHTATFKAICETVGLDEWESIAALDIGDEAVPEKYKKRLSFAIAGSIEELDKQKLDAIVALLKKIGGDTEIEIVSIEEGSIKLTLSGSSDALERIELLFKVGDLTEVLETAIKDVHILTKQELSQLIKRGGCVSLDFSSIDLSSADLVSANLSGANFCNANLSSANLSFSKLDGADMHSADLSNANLSQADLNRASLVQANLSNILLRSANLSNANLSGGNLFNANLFNANLTGAVLNEANLQLASLLNADLSKSDLSFSELLSAEIVSTMLVEADLHCANLRDANLICSDLRRTNLRRANLRGANLLNANLLDADLDRADLHGANLRGANIRYTDLLSADVTYAQFGRGVGFAGISLSEDEKQALVERGAIFDDTIEQPAYAYAGR